MFNIRKRQEVTTFGRFQEIGCLDYDLGAIRQAYARGHDPIRMSLCLD
jgi:hypothetical protein